MTRKQMTLRLLVLSLTVATAALAAEKAAGQATPAPRNPDIILATTTSTVDSGLLDALIPIFEQRTGYRVKTIAAGTGQALAMGEKGEADVLLCHAPESEQKLVDSGAVTHYQLVMHNDFIVVGPSSDPAGIKGKGSVEALRLIGQKEATFISRGDDSGTNKKELAIWKAAGIAPQGKWYQQSGQGMGATLLMSSEKEAYTLADRATFLAQKANLRLAILSEGDKALLNIYHVMQVSPAKFTKVNADGAKAFVDFMVAPDIQKMIGEFGKDKFGQSLFFPDAGKKMEDLG
jgi:tungstate transport system substrate-binding protein